MKQLYTTQNPLMISHLKNILETCGIDCLVKNTYLASAMGELPPIECWPELWVVDDVKYEKARALLEETLSPVVAVKKPWRCKRCGEEVEGQFSECWQCGHSQP